MAAVTNERIWAVADALDAEGENPTYKAVIKRLGGGSYSTISEAMGLWKAKRAAKERTAAVEPAPEAITAALADFGGQVWGVALDLAGKRFATDREALEAARVELEGEKREAIEAADEAAAEAEALKAQVEALTAAEQEARKQAEEAKGQVAASIERATRAETRATEIERRADDLNAELARVNQANAELVKALAAAATAPKKPAKE